MGVPKSLETEYTRAGLQRRPGKYEQLPGSFRLPDNTAHIQPATTMPEDDLFASDISQIKGNASDNIKRTIGNPGGFFQSHPVKNFSSSLFGESILKRMKVVEISLNRKAEEEKKMEARVVVELDVTGGQYTLNPFHV